MLVDGEVKVNILVLVNIQLKQFNADRSIRLRYLRVRYFFFFACEVFELEKASG